MNKEMFTTLRTIHETGSIDSLSQEQTAALIAKGLLNPNEATLTEHAYAGLAPYKVESALILAAGFGSRFVPYTYETPKGLLDVKGEIMLERQIRQLHERGIHNVVIVVGYLKEQFKYLETTYNVILIENPDYAIKNNISSIYHAPETMKTGNVYVLTSDVIYTDNPFHEYEYQSWYSLKYFDEYTHEWIATLDDTQRIQDVTIGGSAGYAMYGPAFFNRAFSKKLYDEVVTIYHDPQKANYYWENVYLDNRSDLPLYANLEDLGVVEFECFEELVAYDPSYDISIRNTIMTSITHQLDCKPSELTTITPIANEENDLRFTFNYNTKHYCARIDHSDFNHVEVYEYE